MGKKEKAAAAVVAVTAAAGMVAGTVIESPVELVEDVLPITDVQRQTRTMPLFRRNVRKGLPRKSASGSWDFLPLCGCW